MVLKRSGLGGCMVVLEKNNGSQAMPCIAATIERTIIDSFPRIATVVLCLHQPIDRTIIDAVQRGGTAVLCLHQAYPRC